MSGYLDDDTTQSSGSSALLAHLQRQSYSHRIPAISTNRGRINQNDIDEVGEKDDELSITTWDSEEEEKRAQEEWEESIKQLNLAFQVIVLPFFGKWLGRKWSYWGKSFAAVCLYLVYTLTMPILSGLAAFSRFQQHGFSSSLFGISWLWKPTTSIPSSVVAALQP